MSTKYDWAAAKELFVDGIPGEKESETPSYLNLRELAEQLDIPYQAVRERASRERWRELRSKGQVEFAKRVRTARAQKMAQEALQFDDKSLSVAKMGINLVQLRLGEIAQHVQSGADNRRRNLERLARGEIVDWKDLYSAVNYKELQGLAIAASTFEQMGQRAMGTDSINVKMSGGVDVTVDHQISVTEEMGRPDAERIAILLSVLNRTNIAPEGLLGITSNGEEDIEGEVETTEELPEGVDG